MKVVLMALGEALKIEQSIKNKTKIQKMAGASFMRLNPAEINNLAGFTVNFCKQKAIQTGKPVNELTKDDLDTIRENFKTQWHITRKQTGNPKDWNNEWWGRMTACEKILENWKETSELEYDAVAGSGSSVVDDSFLDD